MSRLDAEQRLYDDVGGVVDELFHRILRRGQTDVEVVGADAAAAETGSGTSGVRVMAT